MQKPMDMPMVHVVKPGDTFSGICQRYGVKLCSDDGSETECSVTAGAGSTEVCDYFDNNCDGEVDNGCSPS
jgi:hypothetical protein